MNGWEVFLVFHPLHLHFTTEYDIFKYRQKVRGVSFEAFQKRNDRTFFDRIATKAQTKEKAAGLCLANFIYESGNWLHQDLNYSWSVYTLWIKNRKQIKENVEHDLTLLENLIKSQKVESNEKLYTKTGRGGLPPLLQLYQTKKILPETICLLNRNHQFLHNWVDLVSSDPLASDCVFRLIKYTPFCNFSKLEDLAVNV
jgi:hypothetical protein